MRKVLLAFGLLVAVLCEPWYLMEKVGWGITDLRALGSFPVAMLSKGNDYG